MPFSPCHWGPVAVMGLLLFRLFDFPTLLVSCVIADVEGFIVSALDTKIQQKHG